MKVFAVAVSIVASAGVLTLAAQRITTNPADGHLKKMFPQAAYISPHAGTPLHWKIYAEDPRSNPKAQPVALAGWSTDLVPLERGYNGPTHMFIGMDMAGIIIGTVMDFSTDPYAFFSVEPPEFAAQFKGKSIRDPFKVGVDVDAISRATMTVTSATRAIRDSSRRVARAVLSPDAVKR
jgi:transcriptional regulator of nitric oxide reductase